jgi:hypothetical protein
MITISHQLVPVSSIILSTEGGATGIDQRGGTLQILAAILPKDASDTTVSWSVINGTGQATITPEGILQAVGDGTVTVMATANDGSGTRDSLQLDISGQATGFHELPDPAWVVTTEPEHALLKITRMDASMETGTIRIFNMLGQLTYTRPFCGPQHVVDLSSLPGGYYILHLDRTKSTFPPYKFLIK